MAQLRVLDESGTPIAGAELELPDLTLSTDVDGLVTVTLEDGAIAGVVRARSMLDEPVVIGGRSTDSIVDVRMWSNADGKRWTLHASGDVMFGRRYNAPVEGEPLIPRTTAEEGARGVVQHIAPIFGAASVRTINLETVVSDLPDSAAYPGKRFILNSWPDTLAGVEALEPSMVLLANNHAYDYMDIGVTETMRALNERGIVHTGAGDGKGPSDDPVILEAAGIRVGVVGWTTVDGSFVNDNYPEDEDKMPAGIASTERWQWETREWGFTGATLDVPVGPHRIGTAWRLFEDLEGDMSEEEAAAAWTSMIKVYPELQDWVARRGHGGAAPWLSKSSPEKIAALRQAADVVVVQLHAGFQFQPSPSDYVAKVAHDAIDAGADIVICHHPHVLQGTEWYKDKLIIFSLGNFVFDQDFFSTFSTAFIRTVWEGTRMLEARFVPVELVAYRPTPAADLPAERTLLHLWEMSIAEARAARVDGGIRVIGSSLPADALPGQLRLERNTAVIVRESPTPETVTRKVPAGELIPVDYLGLVDPRLGVEPTGTKDIEIGRDLLGWGDFEDPLADGVAFNAAQWAFGAEASYKRVVVADDAPSGHAYLAFSRSVKSEVSVLTRPVARTPLVPHRLYREVDEELVPADPEPNYEVRLKARFTGAGVPTVRLDLYMFDDSNPTEDPSSTVVGETELALDVPADGLWHDIAVEIGPELVTAKDGTRANMIMFYVGLAPVLGAESTLDVDKVELIEWRPANQMPDRYGVYDYVRNRGATEATLEFSGLPGALDAQQ